MLQLFFSSCFMLRVVMSENLNPAQQQAKLERLYQQAKQYNPDCENKPNYVVQVHMDAYVDILLGGKNQSDRTDWVRQFIHRANSITADVGYQIAVRKYEPWGKSGRSCPLGPDGIKKEHEKLISMHPPSGAYVHLFTSCFLQQNTLGASTSMSIKPYTMCHVAESTGASSIPSVSTPLKNGQTNTFLHEMTHMLGGSHNGLTSSDGYMCTGCSKNGANASKLDNKNTCLLRTVFKKSLEKGAQCASVPCNNFDDCPSNQGYSSCSNKQGKACKSGKQDCTCQAHFEELNNSCGESVMPTEHECNQYAKKSSRMKFGTINDASVMRGCFIQNGDNNVYFNENTKGKDNKVNHRSICRKATKDTPKPIPSSSSQGGPCENGKCNGDFDCFGGFFTNFCTATLTNLFEEQKNSPSCGKSTPTEKKCQEYARWKGYSFESSGSWPKYIIGCSVDKSNLVYFNASRQAISGLTYGHKDHRSICKTGGAGPKVGPRALETTATEDEGEPGETNNLSQNPRNLMKRR